MCGITGAIWTDPRLAVERPVLRRMTDVLRHRGPDDAGEYCSECLVHAGREASPGVALGFRRLSIIDVEGGRQPMSNERGDVWLVFNGEIYNYLALRRRLEGAGHVFRTRSDTETIVHLYEEEGVACFRRLNGMFAAALWDASRRQLVLARDRLGQKPLVYRVQPQRLLFASELKSLLEAPGATREIDPAAVDQYLTYQYIPHPKTIFRGVCKLPPGHIAVYRDGRLSVEAYWRPDFNSEQPIGRAAAAARIREAFESSVALRLQSDVPLGAFLSGGVDSSLVVAVMQRLAGQRVKTFSIGFPVPEYDETSFARRVAEHLGTDHHQFQVTPDAVEILPRLIRHFDEPLADSSAVPTWYLSQMTRQHVTVALSGDGGDELFAGYPRYRAVSYSAALDRAIPLRRLLAWRIWQTLPGSSRQKSLVRRLKRFSEFLAASPQRRYLHWIGIFNEVRRAELYTDDFLARLPDQDPIEFLQTAWSRAGRRDPVTAASLADLTTYLPCDLMTKVDIASMAHSLECRQPFLDYRLVELAASLPLRLKYRRGRGKQLLRVAFGSLLPDFVWRRRKMGFGVPLDRWLRNELRTMIHDTLMAPDALCRDFFRREVIARYVEQHVQGRFDHSYRLWALLVFELWLRRWRRAAGDGPGRAAGEGPVPGGP